MTVDAHANALMNNPAFVEALESARSQAITAAMMCDTRDDDGRRRYLDAARIVDRVAGHLNALVSASKSGAVVDPADFYEERAKQRFALFRK